MRILSKILGWFGSTKDRSPSPSLSGGGISVTAQLNHMLMPIDRGDRYESG